MTTYDDHHVTPLAIILRLCIILLILGAGAFGTKKLIETGPKTSRIHPEAAIPTVLTEPCKRQASMPLSLQALGTVIPSSQVTISPRVTSTLVQHIDKDDGSRAHSPLLEPGQHYAQGEILALLDPTDYEHARIQRTADLATARSALKREQGQRNISAFEWEQFTNKETATTLERELILREPELQAAQARVDAAEAALRSATLNIARCTIRAPFDCVLLNKNGGIGSQVTPQTPICTIADSTAFWVRANIPVTMLPHLHADAETGSTAVLTRAGSAGRIEWNARLIRFLPEVETKGRLATILLSVHKPLQSHAPLLLGSSVRIQLHATALTNVTAIATAHLRENNTVWVLDEKSTLTIRPAEIIWIERETAYIRAGLTDGDQLITSNISAPVAGMKLRTPTQKTEATDGN